MFMYKGAYNSILYLLALALLILGAWCKVDWTVILMAFLFFTWDFCFVCGKNSFEGRASQQILTHARDAETLMSYFIGFYAVLFALLAEGGKGGALLQACGAAHLSLLYVAAPLVLASIPMLFIPIQINGDQNHVTTALKSLMFVNVYFEKLVVFIFVHDVLRISRAAFS